LSAVRAAGDLVAGAEPRPDVDALAAVTGIARATAAAATASGRHDRASHDGLPASMLNTAFLSHPEWHGVGRATAVPRARAPGRSGTSRQ